MVGTGRSGLCGNEQIARRSALVIPSHARWPIVVASGRFEALTDDD